MKVSFIVPLYKVEKYFDELISSFSTIKNIEYEVILVNDDPTYKLKFKKKRFKVINNKKNKGLLLSRYEGYLNVSRDSTHIMFVDGDDSINTIDWNKVSKNQITNFDYYEKYSNKKILVKCNGGIGPNKLDNHIWGVLFPIKIIKKYESLLSDNQLFDDFPIKEIISRENKFIKNDQALVSYKMRGDSLSKAKFSRDAAQKIIHSWFYLFNKYHDDHFLHIANEELRIHKKSFTKDEFKNWKKVLGNKLNINGNMYRVVKFAKFKLYFINFILRRKLY